MKVIYNIIGILLFISALNVYAEKIYTLGVVPQFKTKKIHDIWQPIIDEINKQSGIQLKLVSKPNILAFEKSLLSGEFDFAYVNPYQMLTANQVQSYQPLVRDTNKALQGILVVPFDSKINNVKELHNQEIVFPSPNALGASLLIRQELDDDVGILIHPNYVISHDSVYLNVALKQAEAGGGVQKTLNRQSKKIKDRVKVLYRTSKVASHPIAAHPRVDESVTKKLQETLLSFGKKKNGRELLSKIPVSNLGNTSMTEYTPLSKKKLNRFTTEEK